MTFEKWFDSYAPTAPEVLDDCAKDAFDAGAASRDAEIESLRQQLAAALAACKLKDIQIKNLMERLPQNEVVTKEQWDNACRGLGGGA